MGKATAEFWKQCAGQVVDGTFPLHQYLGGSANAAVYRTEFEGQKAALKLVAAEQNSADLLSHWQAASKVSHPHLIQIYKTGRSQVAGASAIYVVTECADEDLSQVIPERPLTGEETHDMLSPVLTVLEYLHAQGWIHGHLKASNIMAVGDQLKISSDGLWRAGETKRAVPTEDVWALGLTLVEVLTQRREALVPPSLPQPFASIVGHCLEPDPAKRWTLAQISARLDGRPSRPPYLIPAGVAAVVLVVAGLAWFTLKPHDSASIATSATSTPIEQAKTPEPTPTPEPAAPVKPQARARVEKPAKPEPESSAPADASNTSPGSGGVVIQVLPDIPAKARSTIHNRAKVTVRVRADPMGNVLDAKLDPPPASRYFGERALKAARLWKFKPEGADQDWVLNFELYRTETKVFPVRVSR